MAERIEKSWENFLKFAKGRIFQYKEKTYFAAHANFFDEIISDLISRGFLKKVGWLSQIVKRKERKKIADLLPVLAGRVTTYEVLKPFF